MNNKDRIKIFENTQKLINNDKVLNNSIFGTKVRQVIYETGHFLPKQHNVSVTKNSTIKAAVDKINNYPREKVAILNFASATNPGGGVTKGSSAQEECICRCTTLYDCLNDDFCWKDFYTPHRTTGNNLHNDDIIYSPDVYIIKDDEYKELKEPLMVDVITCAAPNLRDNPTNSYNQENSKNVKVTDEELLDIHISRAISIFECAKANDVKHLILGAFGCGAFRNNPKVVARAYKNILNVYANCFKTIEFAIYCRDDEMINYNVFNNIIKGR